MFTPVILSSGLNGFFVLEETKESQLEAVAEDVVVQRDLEYFDKNIGTIKTPSELVADRRLLEIAMTAYGLEAEIEKTALIEMVLEGGSGEESFAAQLADNRWLEFAEAFGFGDPNAGYEVSNFQAAVELRFLDPVDVFDEAAVDADDVAQFRSYIGSVQSIDDLLADAQTLEVALAAFGLERGPYTDAHFRQLLTDGPDSAYAQSLPSPLWVSFARAFDGLATGTVDQVSQFTLDVEREIARRGIPMSLQAEADADPGKISPDDIAYFRDFIAALDPNASPGAALAADARASKVARVAYGLENAGKSAAEFGALLDGGSGANSLAAQESNTAWLQLARSFEGLASTALKFEYEIEVGIAERGLEATVFNTPEPAPSIDADELEYFKANIGEVRTADDLVADERVLNVALTAFGLENEGASIPYILELLSEDPNDETAFVNQLSDTRWRDFSLAFNPTGELTPTEADPLDIDTDEEDEVSLAAQPAIWQLDLESRLSALEAPAEDIAYLRENFSSISSALDITIDERLMDVTLSAFGIEQNRFSGTFVQRVLLSDPNDPGSFVNLLNDPRWLELNATIGAGAGQGGNTGLQSFRDDIRSRFIERSFEIAVGEFDQDMRVALNFRREIGDIASASDVADNGWLTLAGNQAMVPVVQATLGLPTSTSLLDLEAQVDIMSQRALTQFGVGDPSFFTDPANVDTAIERYFLSTSQSAAQDASLNGLLTILTNTRSIARGSWLL